MTTETSKSAVEFETDVALETAAVPADAGAKARAAAAGGVGAAAAAGGVGAAAAVGDESHSYRDPLGERSAAASAAARAREAHFVPVASCYDGFYASFVPAGRDGEIYLAGGEGVIGSPLAFRAAVAATAPEGLPGAAAAAPEGAATTAAAEPAKLGAAPELQLLNHAGLTIARLDADTSKRLTDHINSGWQVTLLLSLVLYSQKLRSHTAELACLCYDPAFAETFEAFARNIAFRVRKGDHPALALSQDQFIRVVESRGAWYLTRSEALPAREPGVIVYKRRRSLGEGLVEQAYQGKRGCKLAAIGFWALLAAALLLVLFWWFL
ncbi:MAG: hypothetical protein LBP28_07800 [Coriobacteriales bacterium]|jgi:hypothetical protein|nr:hypothetical protein [Coriobacteriales bacterium]